MGRLHPPGLSGREDTEAGAPRLLVTEPVSAEAPEWSPDRSHLDYAATDPATGTYSLFTISIDSGEKKTVPGSTGFCITRWSPDGKHLAAVTEDVSRIAIFNFATQQWREIAKGKVFSAPFWSLDSKSILFQDILEPDEPTWSRRMATRCSPSTLADLSLMEMCSVVALQEFSPTDRSCCNSLAVTTTFTPWLHIGHKVPTEVGN
jgi:hypothetical protein